MLCWQRPVLSTAIASIASIGRSARLIVSSPNGTFEWAHCHLEDPEADPATSWIFAKFGDEEPRAISGVTVSDHQAIVDRHSAGAAEKKRSKDGKFFEAEFEGKTLLVKFRSDRGMLVEMQLGGGMVCMCSVHHFASAEVAYEFMLQLAQDLMAGVVKQADLYPVRDQRYGQLPSDKLGTPPKKRRFTTKTLEVESQPASATTSASTSAVGKAKGKQAKPKREPKQAEADTAAGAEAEDTPKGDRGQRPTQQPSKSSSFLFEGSFFEGHDDLDF